MNLSQGVYLGLDKLILNTSPLKVKRFSNCVERNKPLQVFKMDEGGSQAEECQWPPETASSRSPGKYTGSPPQRLPSETSDELQAHATEK